MNKKNTLKSVEILEFLDAVPFETYNSFPKIIFQVKGKVGGKKRIFEGTIKILQEDQVEFLFDDELQSDDFQNWIDQLSGVLASEIFEQAFFVMKMTKSLEKDLDSFD